MKRKNITYSHALFNDYLLYGFVGYYVSDTFIQECLALLKILSYSSLENFKKIKVVVTRGMTVSDNDNFYHFIMAFRLPDDLD